MGLGTLFPNACSRFAQMLEVFGSNTIHPPSDSDPDRIADDLFCAFEIPKEYAYTEAGRAQILLRLEHLEEELQANPLTPETPFEEYELHKSLVQRGLAFFGPYGPFGAS